MASSVNYATCFCEENIYHLAQELLMNQIDCQQIESCKLYVVFLGSVGQTTPIWMQKSSEDWNDPVVWDYHVVLLRIYVDGVSPNGSKALIYDFDSTLQFPVDASHYIISSLRPQIRLSKEFEQHCRIVPAQIFLDHFASDRSHMATSGKQYPSWNAIKGPKAQCDMNLSDYTTVTTSSNELLTAHSLCDDLLALHTSSSPLSYLGVVVSKYVFVEWINTFK